MKSITKEIKKENKFKKYLATRKENLEQLKPKKVKTINAPKLLLSVIKAVHLDDKSYSTVSNSKIILDVDTSTTNYLKKRKGSREDTEFSLVLLNGKINEFGFRTLISVLEVFYKNKRKKITLTGRGVRRLVSKGTKIGGKDLKRMYDQLVRISAISIMGRIAVKSDSRSFPIRYQEVVNFSLFKFEFDPKERLITLTASDELYEAMFESQKFFSLLCPDSYNGLRSKSSRMLYSYLKLKDFGHEKTFVNFEQVLEFVDITRDKNYLNKISLMCEEINSVCKQEILLKCNKKKKTIEINFLDRNGKRK